jgi:hypothetical protein
MRSDLIYGDERLLIRAAVELRVLYDGITLVGIIVGLTNTLGWRLFRADFIKDTGSQAFVRASASLARIRVGLQAEPVSCDSTHGVLTASQ